MKLPSRDEAFVLLTEFNASGRAIKHALAVEAVMRHFARRAGADEDQWGILGLIPALDYEHFPDLHWGSARTSSRGRKWRRPSSPWTS